MIGHSLWWLNRCVSFCGRLVVTSERDLREYAWAERPVVVPYPPNRASGYAFLPRGNTVRGVTSAEIYISVQKESVEISRTLGPPNVVTRCMSIVTGSGNLELSLRIGCSSTIGVAQKGGWMRFCVSAKMRTRREPTLADKRPASKEYSVDISPVHNPPPKLACLATANEKATRD